MKAQIALLNSGKRLNNYQLAFMVISERVKSLITIDASNFDAFTKHVSYCATCVENGIYSTDEAAARAIELIEG